MFTHFAVTKIYPVKKILLITLISLMSGWSFTSSAQAGGDGVFEFLNLPNSARIAGLGSNFLAINDNDVTLSLANPSLITEKMHNNLALSFVDYYTDINYGFAQYGRTFNTAGTFVGTMQFISYGSFTEADEAGVKYGEFGASEYALNVGWGRWLTPKFSIGANAKMIYSYFYIENSFGIAVDVAGSYQSPDSSFTASVIFSNIGYQVVPYTNQGSEPLPFEIRAGLSKRFEHVPFRISVLLTHLEKWDLSYDNPNDPANGTDPLTGEVNEVSGVEEFADNFMRHIVFGGELYLGKHLSLQGGYNYQRRQEMKVSGKSGLVGFSFGAGVKVSKFSISYARSTYHLAGSPNYFTFTFNLDEFVKN